MFKFSAVSQIWKKYIQKLNDWDLPLSDKVIKNECLKLIVIKDYNKTTGHFEIFIMLNK